MQVKPININFNLTKKHNEYGYDERKEIHDIQFLNLVLNKEKYGQEIRFEQVLNHTVEQQLNLSNTDFKLRDFYTMFDLEHGVVYVQYKISKKKYLIYTYDLFIGTHLETITDLEYKYLKNLYDYYHDNKLGFLDKEIIINLILKATNKVMQEEFDTQCELTDLSKREIIIPTSLKQRILDNETAEDAEKVLQSFDSLIDLFKVSNSFRTKRHEIFTDSQEFLERIEELNQIKIVDLEKESSSTLEEQSLEPNEQEEGLYEPN